jgi:hypothetical protein
VALVDRMRAVLKQHLAPKLELRRLYDLGALVLRLHSRGSEPGVNDCWLYVGYGNLSEYSFHFVALQFVEKLDLGMSAVIKLDEFRDCSSAKLNLESLPPRMSNYTCVHLSRCMRVRQ